MADSKLLQETDIPSGSVCASCGGFLRGHQAISCPLEVGQPIQLHVTCALALGVELRTISKAAWDAERINA